MNYAAIKKTDVANGPGVRVSLFVSGCTHACKGCFNREAWDFNYGEPFTAETEEVILEALSHDYIRGFSVLGGEPMEPSNRGIVLELLRKVREAYPEKSIWCYTGYDYEEDLLQWIAEGDETVGELLELMDREKTYKSMLKKGYPAGIMYKKEENSPYEQIVGLQSEQAAKKYIEKNKLTKYKLFTSAEDFDIK